MATLPGRSVRAGVVRPIDIAAGDHVAVGPVLRAGGVRPKNWSIRGQDTKGYLRPSILYHMRTFCGGATAWRLEALIGTHVSSVNMQLAKMVADGLLTESTPVAVVLYTLTELGRAEAATVPRERVEFA